MSAIIAGKSCNNCSNDYYLSMGHPLWFDRKIGALYKGYLIARSSGLCPACFIEKIVAKDDDDVTFPEARIISTLAKVLGLFE